MVGQYGYQSIFVFNGFVLGKENYAGIQVRIDGEDWDSAQEVCQFGKFPYRFEIPDIQEGVHTFRAKTINDAGRESAQEKTFVVNVRSIEGVKNIYRNNDIVNGNLKVSGLIHNNNNELVDIWNADFDDVWDRNIGDSEIVDMDIGENPSIISKVIDTGGGGMKNVKYELEYNTLLANPRFEDVWDDTFDDFWNNASLKIKTQTQCQIYIRYSKDNVNWTDWQLYTPATYIFRYIQYKIVFYNVDEAAKICIKKLIPNYNVQKREYIISKTTDKKGYIHITFDDEFYEMPTVISIRSESSTVECAGVENLTTKGCDVRTWTLFTYRDSNGNYRAQKTLSSANFTLIVKGC